MAQKILNMSFDDYKKADGLNASAIKIGAALSMLDMHHYLTAKQDTATDAMQMGTLLHLALLEPDKLKESVAVWAGCENSNGEWTFDRRGKAYNEFCNANIGRYIIKPAEIETIDKVRAAVLKNSDAREIIEQSEHEVALFWEHHGIAKKARCDMMLPDGSIWDLKTTATFAKFPKSVIWDRGYVQAGHYVAGSMALNNKPKSPMFGWIVVSTVEPIAVKVLPATDTLVDYAIDESHRICYEYSRCLESGIFPNALDDMSELDLPESMLESEID